MILVVVGVVGVVGVGVGVVCCACGSEHLGFGTKGGDKRKRRDEVRFFFF